MNNNTKLIIVEGIMGSGKTSIAKFLKDFFDKQQILAELFLEGDLDHPVDFEGVACLNEQEYNMLVQNHANHTEFIRKIVSKKKQNYFFYYKKAKSKFNNEFQDDLYRDILKYEIYELPLDRHVELLLQSWNNFANQLVSKSGIIILECCFFQNPMCALLARNNADRDFIIKHVLKLTEIIEPFNPILIYFHQVDIKETIIRASKDRSREWFDFAIQYHTEQDYGKVHRLSGFDGFIEFLEVRKKLEMEIFKMLLIDKLMIDNSDYNWEKSHQEIISYLKSK